MLWLAVQTPPPGEVPYVAIAAPAPGVSTCPDGLCGTEALDGVFAALEGLETGARDQPVHILQIGDSHTAGDRITGALRARLQARFGAAGRGVLPPGVPYAGYAPYQVQVEATAWPATPAAPLGPYAAPAERTGLSGTRAWAGGPAARLILTAEPGAAFDVLALCGDGGPAAGMIAVTSEAGMQVEDFRAEQDQPLCLRQTFDRPVAQAMLTPMGAVALHDIRLERRAPGVIVSNLGVVGSGLRDLAGRDEAIVAVELAAWRPALVILAYGVNNGFDPALDPVAYEGLLRGQVERLRRLAPAASLMLLGAPEGLKGGQVGGCGADGTRRAPANLALVRDVQRRVAADMGVAFWDWHGRMGGDCSAERLATMAEPYMRPDRVHFTSVGADWIGGMLSDDLATAYERWKARTVEAAD